MEGLIIFHHRASQWLVSPTHRGREIIEIYKNISSSARVVAVYVIQRQEVPGCMELSSLLTERLMLVLSMSSSFLSA